MASLAAGAAPTRTPAWAADGALCWELGGPSGPVPGLSQGLGLYTAWRLGSKRGHPNIKPLSGQSIRSCQAVCDLHSEAQNIASAAFCWSSKAPSPDQMQREENQTLHLKAQDSLACVWPSLDELSMYLCVNSLSLAYGTAILLP